MTQAPSDLQIAGLPTSRSVSDLTFATYQSKDFGNNGETMGNNYEPDEICYLRSFDSYQEMKYKFLALRSLVCDLLKTNQELRNALHDTKSSAHCSEGSQSRNTPR